MTKGLLISRKTKLELQKNSIVNKSEANITKFKHYKNMYNRLVRMSKKLYYEEAFHRAKDPKSSWKLIKEAMNTGNTTKKIEKIKVNGVLVSEKNEMASKFNEFFVNAGQTIANQVPPTTITPDSFLPPPTNHLLEFQHLSQAEVVDVMRALKSKNSQDAEGLSIKILKQVAMELSIPLTHLYNLSLRSGKFPEKLKTSRIVPLHKGGDPELCDNYRPIALLSSISKTLEKIVSIKLTNHLELHGLLYPGQFGFQRFKSTEHNLIRVVNFISENIEKGNFVLGIFLDLKKAFDLVSHDILLKKLDNLGVRGVALDWFTSYLSNRSQIVDIDGAQSAALNIPMSVIQGSILGPILFNIFINDLPCATSSHLSLFADDTQALLHGNCINDLFSRANLELDKMARWFRANRLVVNTKKTQFIVFHSKHKKLELGNLKLVYNDNEPGANNPELINNLERIHSNHAIPANRQYRLLGIIFDENLTFEKNTKAILAKLSRSLYFINKVKNILPSKALISLYHSLIHSHLTYCTSITSSASNTSINKIHLMQKKAIRAVCNAGYREHTTPLLTKLNILTFPNLITQAKLHMMHSIHYKYAPKILHNLWTLNSDRPTQHNLRNADEYEINRIRYNYLTNTPYHSLPKLWNTAMHNLPAIFHSNPTTFKISLKESLIMQQQEQTAAQVTAHAPEPALAPTLAPTPAPAPAPAPALAAL
jgi:hypothetical protein